MRRSGNKVRTLFTLAGALVVAVVAGFLAFAGSVVSATAPANPEAEGIVVLTGDSARIDAALRLLAEGRATRLLISGVNPSVSAQALAGTLSSKLDDMLTCCVDLGRAAEDTVGNALETRDWAKSRNFASLIVVTSAYHMPRSLAELADTMPGVALIAYPVENPDLHLDEWWTDPRPFSVLVREYSKYLLTATRLMLTPKDTASARAAGK